MTSLVFGIFEYGRLMMDWSLLNNAAREGCRYALANNTSTTISTDVQGIVTAYMAGQTTSFQNFTVTVTGTASEGSRRRSTTWAREIRSRSRCPASTSFMNIIPLAQMPTSWTMSSSVTMLCEGGT